MADYYRRQISKKKKENLVPLKETIKGFKAIINGEMDDYPEAAFLLAGTIEDVKEKAKTLTTQE